MGPVTVSMAQRPNSLVEIFSGSSMGSFTVRVAPPSFTQTALWNITFTGNSKRKRTGAPLIRFGRKRGKMPDPNCKICKETGVEVLQLVHGTSNDPCDCAPSTPGRMNPINRHEAVLYEAVKLAQGREDGRITYDDFTAVAEKLGVSNKAESFHRTHAHFDWVFTRKGNPICYHWAMTLVFMLHEDRLTSEQVDYMQDVRLHLHVKPGLCPQCLWERCVCHRLPQLSLAHIYRYHRPAKDVSSAV